MYLKSEQLCTTPQPHQRHTQCVLNTPIHNVQTLNPF